MKDKYKASASFKALTNALVAKVGKAESVAFLADKAAGRSKASVRAYSADPDAPHFRIPPIDVLERMRDRVMHEDVHRTSALRALAAKNAYVVCGHSFDDYLIALDFGDRHRLGDVHRGEVRTKGDAVMPTMTQQERLRHQWRKVFFGGIVDRNDLAAIAGVDFYAVAWVGREHPVYGIQPTFDQVAAATALEAMTSGRAAA